MKRSEDAKKDREMKEFFNSQVEDLDRKKVIIDVSVMLTKMGYLYYKVIEAEESHYAHLQRYDMGYVAPKIFTRFDKRINKLKDRIISMLNEAKIDNLSSLYDFHVKCPNHKIEAEMFLVVEDIIKKLELKDYNKPAKYQRLTLKQLKRMEVKSK